MPRNHGVYEFIDGELAVRQRQHGAPRTVQVLPRKNYDPGAMARQAREEAQQRSRTSAYANIPDNYNDDDADIDGNGDIWPPVPPNSIYRYDTTLSDSRNVRYEFHPDQMQHIPRRSSATSQRQQGREAPQRAYTDDEGEERRTAHTAYRRRVHMHWSTLLAIGAILALTIWISGAWVISWWQNTQNDWTYTAQFRTFSINQAVGHNNDSNTHPSHFIVQNDNRHIIIIELPANDVAKAIIYAAPTLIGDGQDKTPATISFVENSQTGRLDLVLHVQDQTYLFTNNGQKFVTPQGQ